MANENIPGQPGVMRDARLARYAALAVGLVLLWLSGLACCASAQGGCSPPPVTPSPTDITVIDPTQTPPDTPAPSATPTPLDATTTPGASSKPHIEVSASQTALKVGDEVTVTGKSVGIGLELFAISFSSGGRFVVSYDNKPGPTIADPLFDLVSLRGMNGGVEVVLRARAPGTTTITISASGEILFYPPDGTSVWMWGDGGSDPLEIVIGE
jgi:hypothetical protein